MSERISERGRGRERVSESVPKMTAQCKRELYLTPSIELLSGASIKREREIERERERENE